MASRVICSSFGGTFTSLETRAWVVTAILWVFYCV
jgi:hypothetical protein